jgi:hypothetical protein
VTHILKNENRKSVACSPWALSVMAQRGTAIVPLPRRIPNDKNTAPNQNWSIWAYTDMGDPRLQIGSRYVRVRQDSRRDPLKIGFAVREGWAAYLFGGMLFVKLFERDDRSSYPDGQVNFEVYTDKRILEMESLGPLRTLKPGASVRFDETWHLFRGVPCCGSEQDVSAWVLPKARKLLAGRARSG